MVQLCDDETMSNLLEAMSQTDFSADVEIGNLISKYPGDARLYFLLGSHQAGARRLIEAHISFKKAIEIEPDFAIARFQLGLFELTSGDVEEALSTWSRLELLGDDQYLKLFVRGMQALVRDDFALAVEKLNAGIQLNSDNEPLNKDMRMVLSQIESLQNDIPVDEVESSGSESVSEASLFLKNKTGRIN